MKSSVLLASVSACLLSMSLFATTPDNTQPQGGACCSKSAPEQKQGCDSPKQSCDKDRQSSCKPRHNDCGAGAHNCCPSGDKKGDNTKNFCSQNRPMFLHGLTLSTDQQTKIKALFDEFHQTQPRDKMMHDPFSNLNNGQFSKEAFVKEATSNATAHIQAKGELYQKIWLLLTPEQQKQLSGQAVAQ